MEFKTMFRKWLWNNTMNPIEMKSKSHFDHGHSHFSLAWYSTLTAPSPDQETADRCDTGVALGTQVSPDQWHDKARQAADGFYILSSGTTFDLFGLVPNLCLVAGLWVHLENHFCSTWMAAYWIVVHVRNRLWNKQWILHDMKVYGINH